MPTPPRAAGRKRGMHYSVGHLRCADWALYADVPEGRVALRESGKRRVFLPIGNCLIGNVNNTRESMAIAWMNSARAAAMVGYVVPPWYGRSGWGGLKYWLPSPGRYTLAEAFFLNPQALPPQLDAFCPGLAGQAFPLRTERLAEEH